MAAVGQKALATQKFKRSTARSDRPNSISGTNDGISNSNRWSQSTSSSGGSFSTTQQGRTSFARRFSGSFGGLGNHYYIQRPHSSKTFVQKKAECLSNSPPGSIAMPASPAPSQPPSGHPSAASTLVALSYTTDSTLAPNFTTTTPAPTNLSSSGAPESEGADYFGQSWGNSTPPRRSKASVRSPSSPYSPQAAKLRIQPGAKNSFANAAQTRTQIASTFLGSTSPPPRQSPEISLNKPKELEIDRRQSRDIRVVREESLASTHDSGEKVRRKKTPSQKMMLSQALQKANDAVVLDNAQKFEGAIEAYGDACDLLQQVMLRSPGDEEKRKLDAIRNTYKNRIRELRSNELTTYYSNDKALPDVPVNTGLRSRDRTFETTDDESEEPFQRMTGRHDGLESRSKQLEFERNFNHERLPPRRQSLMPTSTSGDQIESLSAIDKSMQHQNSWKLDLQRGDASNSTDKLSNRMDKDYMPPPLSPHRPPSPSSHGGDQPVLTSQEVPPSLGHFQSSHSRQGTAESTSWLDTIDESGGSSSSSVHSRSSSIGLRRKHIRTGSGATEAEFDAALDAAVEAAYDDGYEPVSDDDDPIIYEPTSLGASSSYLASVKKNIDLAKQRVRDAEREAAIVSAREHEKRRLLEQNKSITNSDALGTSYEENEAAEEERMLEEWTREYILDDTDFGLRSKNTLPRQSDSSGLSGRTWGSSVGSIPVTAGTTLSTVIENAASLPSAAQLQNASASNPAPPSALPPPPPVLPGSASKNPISNMLLNPKPPFAALQSPGVRDRRLSGQKVNQLKIDTSTRLPLGSTGPKTQPPELSSSKLVRTQFDDGPKSASLPLEAVPNSHQESPDQRRPEQMETADTRDTTWNSLKAPIAESVPDATALASGQDPHSQGEDALAMVASPGQEPKKALNLGALRKNYSSSSLKSLRQQLPTPSVTEDSPGTPTGRAFSSSSLGNRNDSHPIIPDVPTPAATTFSKSGLVVGSLSFLDSDIHSSLNPGSPNEAVANAPVPLEPCPESFLLRPFWLMRAIYQTIAHPRGGYISTRLFVPRDAWRVKNVKLKCVDEKVANCDLLTAALLNLQKVDTLDADAVLEEMQAFELILDQVQVQLGKKLGPEVGVSGSAAIFRASPIADESGTDSLGSKGGTASSKSYLSWKRLRPKHSAGSALPPLPVTSQIKENAKESLTIRSLPMTATPNPRFAKRDPTKVLGIGPHSHYMAALGRLCDAVQILDQLTRQVEDPGLRLSSQTHVGLELCVRHAAEFFGFFICRFALTDIGMMLDKFVKRGSEWVLA